MKFSIIGAGNGGQSMAAHLSHLGQEVMLFDIESSLISAINEAGGIKAEGAVEGFFPVKGTNDIGEALKNTEVIMVTTTATAHKSVARSIAPFLQDNQIIVIFPGYWGALEFRAIFKEFGVEKRILIAETESLIYTCRSLSPGHVNIRKIKDSLEFATLPSEDAVEIKERLKDVYPQLIPAASVLQTTLNNVNPIFHVPITLLNVGRIESPGDFFFYPDGASRSVVNVMEQMEYERLELGKALGIELSTCIDLIHRFYNVEANNLYDAIQNNKSYQTGKAPTTLNYRYIYEDIPYGLLPMIALGEAFNVPTKCMDLFVDLASFVMKKDLRAIGVGLHELGLSGMSCEEIRKYLR